MRQLRFPGESTDLRRARILRERVDDLRIARQRIIAAADEERRRIERDLHDGAQQRLVSVALTLGMAESRLATDPEAAAKLIAERHDASSDAKLVNQAIKEIAGR